MVSSIRKTYNDAFTKENYAAFLEALDKDFPCAIDFRIAETPVFVDRHLGDQMIETCEYIIDFIKSNAFTQLTQRAIPEQERMNNEDEFPHFIAFDFGICEHDDGERYPALIEMQGFPTLFGFQAFYPAVLEKYFPIPIGYSHYFNGLDQSTYLNLLKEVIVGDLDPEQVILLEIKPHTQKTRVDFYCTEKYLGISIVCITELIKEDNSLYYLKNERKIQIKRIYNRVIADELNAVRHELGSIVELNELNGVEWIPHPHWFYRISKFTMPYLHHPCIPQTWFLNEVVQIPKDLENYVLKPLFSFAGQGVVIDLTMADIEKIEDPENWILQKKVRYAACIETPDEPAKAEIRLMYIWKKNDERPTLVTNLARLSKGKMIGVRYNKDKEWVGGSVAYFEK